VVPPTFRPMLASTAQVHDLVNGAFRYEPKFDGWRALGSVCGKGVTVRSRTGRDLSASLPELAGLRDAVGGHDVVLDGELVAGQGRPQDFYRLAPLLTASRAGRSELLTFVVFDVLWLDDASVCARSYVERRRLLDELGLAGACWQTAPVFDYEPADLIAACIELGLEGVVAKRVSGRYRPGRRTREWLKLKTAQWGIEHADQRRKSADRRVP
jgi:bifunctional non-homologous end joining protein LigD